MKRLVLAAMTVAILATLGACRDGGDGDADGDADCEPGSLRYCCWDPGGGERIGCVVEAICNPTAPEECSPVLMNWHLLMAEGLVLDAARDEWDGDPCYVEDVDLDAECQ